MSHHETIETTATKDIVGIYQPGSTHMVGDGFPVRNLFPSNELDREVSPFLMLDYAGPQYFTPTGHLRGVGHLVGRPAGQRAALPPDGGFVDSQWPALYRD